MNIYDQYETVVGLEVHVQLQTKSKIFAPDHSTFGAQPNTQVSYITLAHPGTLPVLNELAVTYAIRMGLATHCQIQHYNQFARKNYFYADLPKGYQISQDKTPICYGGYIDIKNEDGNPRKINLTRIHLEEDAGKSTHDLHPTYSLIDLNRAGTALIEVVSEPDIRSGDEAAAYLAQVRRLVQFLGICDGNMEEGSLRCDANVSVRKKGDNKLGQRVEIKNMNSIRHVKRAIEQEAKRQIDLLENGEIILQQTRSYDANNHTTFALRTKESEDDYRYFPEPDLPPLILNNQIIQSIADQMPELPHIMQQRYKQSYGLNEYDAALLTEEPEIAQYFNELANYTDNKKAAANWLLGPIKSYLNEHNHLSIDKFALKPKQLAKLINLVETGQVSFSVAAQQLLPAFIAQTNAEPIAIAQKMQLIIQNDSKLSKQLIEQVLNNFPDKVKEYRQGKKGLIGFFMGEIMRQSNVKLDPQQTNKLLNDKLNEQV